MLELLKKLILLYTIVLTITNLYEITNINWLYVVLPFWIFIFGPAIFTFIFKKIFT